MEIKELMESLKNTNINDVNELILKFNDGSCTIMKNECWIPKPGDLIKIKYDGSYRKRDYILTIMPDKKLPLIGSLIDFFDICSINRNGEFTLDPITGEFCNITKPTNEDQIEFSGTLVRNNYKLEGHKLIDTMWEVGDLVMENFIYSPRVCLISDFVDNEYITQYIDVDNELITTTSKRGSFSRIGEYDKLLFINNVKNKNYKIENHKIVKWRAHELEEYIYINETLSITSTHDTNTPIDNERFKIGNYFNPECTEYVENIIKTIKDIYIK